MNTNRSLVTLFALTGLAAPGLCGVTSYDPALGTLPESQGWDYLGDGPSAPGAVVAGGQLSYGPSSTPARTFWATGTTPADFTTETWVFEFDLRLTNASYEANGQYSRGGFSIYMRDSLGNYISADVGSSALGLRNVDWTNGQNVATDLSGTFRTLRLEAGPGGAAVYINNSLISSLALGTGGSNSSFFYWGEASILASAELTEVRGVNLVPAPGAAALLGLGGLITMRRRR